MSDGRLWNYGETNDQPDHQLTREGLFQPGRIDERVATWDRLEPSDPKLQRQVQIDDKAWNDDLAELSADEPDKTGVWTPCRGVEEPFPTIRVGMNHPETDNSSTCCALRFGPGAVVPVGPGVATAVDGEAMTTYEIVGRWREDLDAAGTPLRASVTVDDARQLRRALVWDGQTGQVYIRLWADPAPPDHPPITEPTDEPAFATGPPPATPTTSVVPVDVPDL